MSTRVGPVTVLPADGGPSLPGSNETSENTRQLVDEEVRRLVDAAHERVDHPLRTHRGQLDSLEQALLEAETLDARRRLRRCRRPDADARGDRIVERRSTPRTPKGRNGGQSVVNCSAILVAQYLGSGAADPRALRCANR